MILIFDMSGVVFSNGLKIAIDKISKSFDLDPKEIKFIFDSSFSDDYRIGKGKSEDFWEKAKKYLKVENIEEIKTIFFEAYTPQDNMFEFIKEIKIKGIKVGLLSNSPEDRTEYLNNKHNFIGLFDFSMFSFEAHAVKPDKEIFERLIKKYNIDPKEVIYIDDKEKYLAPAKELGMKIIHFKDIDQLKRELKDLGIDM